MGCVRHCPWSQAGTIHVPAQKVSACFPVSRDPWGKKRVFHCIWLHLRRCPKHEGQTRILAAGRAMEAVTDAPFTLLVLPGELAERSVRPAPRATQGPSYARS